MSTICYKKEGLSPLGYYQKHLEIVTLFMPWEITKTEILVLASFMALEGDIVSDDRFCTSARKQIRAKLKMSPGGLGNHLKALKNNYYIKEDENGNLFINPHLIPENKKFQSYKFQIVSNG